MTKSRSEPSLPSAFAPCPAPFNMAEHVLGAGHDTALALETLGASETESGIRLSYGALRSAVRGIATGLLATGLTPGDRILLRLPNALEFPLAYLGAIAAGMVPVATSPQLTRAEITPMARLVAPALILSAPDIALPDLADVPLLGPDDLANFRTLPPARFHRADPNRAAYIVFTSGTERAPKAVLHAHRAIWARRAMHRDWEGLTASDRLLHAGAFNWTYTMGTGLMDPWSVGATALIPAPDTAPADMPTLLARHGATIFAAVPGVFRQMMKASLPPLPDLRHALSAGERLPDALRARWQTATGTDIHEAYGLSECSTFVSGGPTRPAPPGLTGWAQTGRRVAVLGADGPVTDTPGMLAVGADDPGLMLGYLDDPDASSAKFRDGWFLTGDLAEIRADGAIRYLGRGDDVMTAGGYRVSPLEVEEVALEVPGVIEAAAHEWQVRADVSVIALSYVAEAAPDGCGPHETALARHCAERLARYKCPRVYLRRDTLPRSANGKLRRKELTYGQHGCSNGKTGHSV